MIRSDFASMAQSTRRGFLQGSAMAAGALALPAGALAQPKRGGVLRYGVAHGSTTDSLDPGSWDNDFVGALSFLTHQFLLEIDHEGKVQPELATNWEHSDGAKVWTFELKPGVEFHNGKTVTAEDVIASYQIHMGEDSTSAVKPQLSSVVDIRADGPHTVVFTLDGGNVDFPYTVTDAHLPILPSADGRVAAESRIGCGAYVMNQFEPGVRYEGTRHPNYHREDRGHFDEVQMLAIVDPAARTNALRSGDVDLIGRVDLKTVHLLQRDDTIDIKSVAGSQHYTFPMNTQMAPFDNNDVRLALKYAIRREEVVEKVLQGYGTVGNDHPIGPSTVFFNQDLPIREYDPDRAKDHLKKAGLSELTVQLSAADAAFAGAVDAALLFSEAAKAANINIEVVREPNDGYWSNVWMQKPWSISYWGGRVVPNEMFTAAYASGGAWNESFWEHERFNELLVQGRAESDPAIREQIYGEMQRLVRDEGGTVIPLFGNFVFAASKKLAHGPLASNTDMDGHRFGLRWWFA